MPDHWKQTCVESQQFTPLFTGAHQFWQSWSVWHCCAHDAASLPPPLPASLPGFTEPLLLPPPPVSAVVDAS